MGTYPSNRPLPIDAALGELLYHYTTAETDLAHVLGSGRLRLSPFTSMNDPREAKEWTVTVATSDPEYGGVDLNDITRDFNAELKRKIKVACFTADVVRRERGESFLDRGWAHPRMWAYYAANHAGLCIVFRRDRLLTLFERAYPAKGAALSGTVRYSDEDPLANRAFMLNAADVRRRGMDIVLSEHAEKYGRDLFFTKLTDWASENEFRLLVQGQDSEPVYLEVEDALAGVCVGHHWDRRMDDELFAACAARGVEISQVWWLNGHPDITAYAHEETRSEVLP